MNLKITWNPDTKTVIYRSRRSWHTKRNFEVFKATDFLAAAIEHIPPTGQQRHAAMSGTANRHSRILLRRSQTIRYYGLYSNKTRGLTKPTPKIIPRSCGQRAKPQENNFIIHNSSFKLPSARAMRPLWRDLILRVWGTDPLKCPCCQGTMQRIETTLRP